MIAKTCEEESHFGPVSRHEEKQVNSTREEESRASYWFWPCQNDPVKPNICFSYLMGRQQYVLGSHHQRSLTQRESGPRLKDRHGREIMTASIPLLIDLTRIQLNPAEGHEVIQCK